MTIFGRIWTASIAYVALAVGAGLSIMYNVLQTIEVRGPLLGVPDIVTAVAMPGIVVLMVELFVSRLWIGMAWYVQVLRVVATAAIGGVAMRASWVHGHDWMIGHGHSKDVAILWPLAIDLLAILATALLLAGRRGQLAIGRPVGQTALAMSNDLGQVANGGHVANGQPFWPPAPPVDMSNDLGQPDIVATGRFVDIPSGPDNALANIMANAKWTDDLANFDRHVNDAIEQTGQDLADETEQYLAAAFKPLPQRVRPAVPVVPGATFAPVEGWPEQPYDLLRAWASSEGFAVYNGSKVDQLLAGWFDKTPRTARRWRSAVTGSTSAPPDQGGE